MILCGNGYKQQAKKLMKEVKKVYNKLLYTIECCIIIDNSCFCAFFDKTEKSQYVYMRGKAYVYNQMYNNMVSHFEAVTKLKTKAVRRNRDLTAKYSRQREISARAISDNRSELLEYVFIKTDRDLLAKILNFITRWGYS